MKRSELLQHMIDEIADHRGRLELRPKTEPYFNKDLADDLLNLIEGFGMLPPYVHDKECDRIMPSDWLLDISPINCEFSWEPEDV